MVDKDGNIYEGKFKDGKYEDEGEVKDGKY